jgi:hypothetical protein
MPEDFNPEALEEFQFLQNAGRVPRPSTAFNALQNVDALFQGTEVPLPSTVILDYLYGIAAYKAWRSKRGDGFNRMEAYREINYKKISPLHSPLPDDTNVTSGSDNGANDSDYTPPQSRRSGLEETMDELNIVLMYIHGITPKMAAERRQKKIEREEQAAQEASRSKVTEWRKHLDVY